MSDKSTDSKAGITYTADHVPVKVLYVSGMKLEISESDLIKYFSTQGQLANFVLHVQEGHIYALVTYEYALVTFDTFEDATKVLKNKQHSIKGRRLGVRPADACHQPKPEPEVAENKVVEFVYDENAPSLMMLNDDCLLYLLDFFKVLEIIKLRGMCTRLDTLIDKRSQKFINFDFESLESVLTLMNYRDILTFLGPNMKSLIIDGTYFNSNSNRTIEWIARYCKNIDNLKLKHINLLTIMKLKPLTQHLKSLSIFVKRNEDDDLGICFQDMTQLEELTIYGNWEITGKCLTKLSNLKTLSVNSCECLQSEPFEEALMKNKTLKKLEIRVSCQLDNSVVNCIVSNVQGIEELSLGNIYASMSTYHLADLPHLKKLSLESTDFTAIEALLEKLGEKNILEELLYIGSESHPVKEAIKHISKITNLRVFSMAFNTNLTNDELKSLQNLTKLTSLSIPGAKSVTANGLLAFLSACEEIKYLDVSESEVDIEFLEKVIHMWKQSVNRPKLELIVFKTKIDEKSKDVQKLLNENRFHVKTSFTCKYFNHRQSSFIYDSDYLIDDSDYLVDDSDYSDDSMDFIDDDEDYYGAFYKGT